MNDKISVDQFKQWLKEFVVSLNGKLPQVEHWKEIKRQLDRVEDTSTCRCNHDNKITDFCGFSTDMFTITNTNISSSSATIAADMFTATINTMLTSPVTTESQVDENGNYVFKAYYTPYTIRNPN